jgi:hypothetical protein
VEWNQAAKILPLDPVVRAAILEIEEEFERWMSYLEPLVAHLPSRLRSLVWVLCAIPVLEEAGQQVPSRQEVIHQLLSRLPVLQTAERQDLLRFAAVTEVVPAYVA